MGEGFGMVLGEWACERAIVVAIQQFEARFDIVMNVASMLVCCCRR